MPSYYFNERFYIVYNINLIMFYDLLIFIFMSYIKPQPASSKHRIHPDCISYYSYIKPQQYQETRHTRHGCISYYSYIKPQHIAWSTTQLVCCISYYSYIKPQQRQCNAWYDEVVYRTIPTSNHNLSPKWYLRPKLYIVLFLHQTTTTTRDKFHQ